MELPKGSDVLTEIETRIGESNLGPDSDKNCLRSLFPLRKPTKMKWEKEKAFEIALSKAISKDRNLRNYGLNIESQRRHPDATISDLVLTCSLFTARTTKFGIIEGSGAENIRGRPFCVIETKLASLNDNAVAKGTQQVMHYVREILACHCGTFCLPFILISPHNFTVGLAYWNSYSSLRFVIADQTYAIYKR